MQSRHAALGRPAAALSSDLGDVHTLECSQQVHSCRGETIVKLSTNDALLKRDV